MNEWEELDEALNEFKRALRGTVMYRVMIMILDFLSGCNKKKN